MLHPADKHSSNGILRNTSYNHARDSSLRISVRSFFHSVTYDPDRQEIVRIGLRIPFVVLPSMLTLHGTGITTAASKFLINPMKVSRVQ